MTELLKYIIIGIVQGIAEVLPISSSAHLIIFSKILGLENNLAFEIFLHLGSLFAVIMFLRKKILKLLLNVYKYLIKKQKEFKKDFLYFCYILLSTLIVVIVTVLFNDYLEVVNNYVWLVGIFLIINGIMLFIFFNNDKKNNRENLNYKDAICIGLFESIAILPGISRSGACLIGGRVRKLDNETSGDYTFMLFIPAVIGGFVLKVRNISELVINNNIICYITCFIITSITTFISFMFLLKIIKKGKLSYFGYYCVILGLLTFILNISN